MHDVPVAEDVVAVLLPGQGYTLAHPLLHYAARTAEQAGMSVFKVDYGDTRGVPFAKVAELACAEARNGCAGASRVILVGKSLGTFVMATLLQNEDDSRRVIAATWLTPLIGHDYVYEAMQRFIPPALAVIGSRDPHYLPERLDALPTATQVTVVRHADHALEVPDGVDASVRGLQTTVLAMRGLLSRVPS